MEDLILQNNSVRKIKKGFTLIEMLVVIVIVGILAAVAISSFGSARESARFQIALDSIMSTIKEQKGKAQTGRQSGGAGASNSQCFGIIFHKSSGVTAPAGFGAVPAADSIQTITVPYVATPQNPTDSNADYCDGAARTMLPVPVSGTDGLTVLSIAQGANNSLNDVVLMFKPPFGTPGEAPSLDQVSNPNYRNIPTQQNPLNIIVNFSGNSPQAAKGLQFDAFSGVVSQVNAPTITLSPSPVTQ